MKNSAENLEQVIHRALRSAAPHRAPNSLESRVLAAIESRAKLPWWRQSFARWPLAARVGFVAISTGLAIAGIWMMAGFDSAEVTRILGPEVSWIDTIVSTVDGIRDLAGAIYRGIPPLWLYGGLVLVTTLYVAFFGLGAAAYRTLHTRH